MRELDGAFLSYGSGHASYLNPSIREFIAALITEDQDTSEDLLHSAVCFNQIAALKEPSNQHPESPVVKVLAASGDIPQRLLRQLLRSPSTRWEKTRSGMAGRIIDLGSESRIGFMAELSETFTSLPLLERAVQSLEQLISSWNGVVPEFTTVLLLLKNLQNLPWFLSHGGRALSKAT